MANYDNCKGKDIFFLSQIIKDLVYMKYKTNLEYEIIILK